MSTVKICKYTNFGSLSKCFTVKHEINLDIQIDSLHLSEKMHPFMLRLRRTNSERRAYADCGKHLAKKLEFLQESALWTAHEHPGKL